MMFMSATIPAGWGGGRGLRMLGHHCNNETGDRYPENCSKHVSLPNLCPSPEVGLSHWVPELYDSKMVPHCNFEYTA
jgi:hypothetical protein